MNLANSDHGDSWNISTIAGYSGKTLTKKLGIMDETRFLVINQPENYFKLLPDLPFEAVVLLDKDAQGVDLIHYFTKNFDEFKRDLPKLKNQIYKNGTIWVSWPKKASKVATDMDENKVRELALEIGLVDVKVCAVDEIWSGLKLVIPVKDREFKQLLEEI
jgi:hypothetical protein